MRQRPPGGRIGRGAEGRAFPVKTTIWAAELLPCLCRASATLVPRPASNQAFPIGNAAEPSHVIHPGYIADKVNEYRLRAAECRNHAAKAPTAELREHYLWLANMWHELAQSRASFLKSKDVPE